MKFSKQWGTLQPNRQLPQRVRALVLSWMALGSCLVLAGCGGTPDAAPTSGDVHEIKTKLTSVINPGDQALHILGKCVDVPGANDTNGTTLQLYDCNGGTNQQWEFWWDSTVRPTFNTNKCLDLPGADTDDGTPIQIYDCNGGGNQQWSLATDGTLRGYGSKCVDVPGFQTADGTTLQYYDCNGGSNQMFMRAPPTIGTSQLWNLKAEEENTGADASMCIGIAGGVQNGGVVNYGTGVVIWDCNGSPDQQWTRTFQSDPSGTSGQMDLVNSVQAHRSANDGTYPVCLFGSADTPIDGDTMKAQYCPEESGIHTDFVFNYVQNDAYGFPCFTLQNPETGLYLGVANAQANPVQNGMNIIWWDQTPSHDQIWCDHSANTETFTITPDFVVTSVIYAPPGKASSMQYTSSTTVGSSLSTSKSFQNSTDVTASTSVSGGVGMASASVSYNHTFGDSDTHEVDQTTTWTQGYKKPGETDGIDHDLDEIWFIIHPILNMSFMPGFAGAPDMTNWQFGQGDGVNTGIIYFAYAGELNGDMPMDSQLQDLFYANNITPDMYPGILDADAFFQGVSPQQGMTSERFDYLGEYPYQPPLVSGQMPSAQSYGVSQSTTTSDTHVDSYSNQVGFSISGGLDVGKLWKVSLSVSDKMTWSHSTSNKESSGSGSVDTLTVAQPAYGYTGPGLLHVYEDRIFKTYAFTLDYAGPVSFADDGSTGCGVGGVWMHCCPPGEAMVGARLDQNVFKCAELQDGSGEVVADFSTYRSVSLPSDDGTTTNFVMHACPFGYVMVGYHEDMDVLACQKIPPNTVSDSITGELVDTGTQDGYMHTCESTPYAYAMSGIDPGNNLLLCATSPGLK